MADGTSICPRCDFIIDSSFLSDASGEEAPAAAEPRPSSRPPSRPTGARPAAARGTGARPAARGTGVRPAATGAASKGAPPARRAPSAPPVDEEESTNAGPPPRAPSRPARPASRPARPGGRSASAARAPARAAPRTETPPPAPIPTHSALPRVTGNHRLVSPEEMLADLKNFLLELGQSDKLAFLGALATVLLSFIPWKSTAADGDVLGLVSLGVFVLIAAVGSMAAVAVRVRKVMPQLNPIIPWLVQLGTSVFAIVWCLVFIRLAWNGQQVPADIGNEMVPLSSPSAGVFLALLASLVSLAGTLMGLKEKPN